MMQTKLIDWLLTPLSGAAEHSIAMPVAWHGRLMVLAWGILVPCGILVARYFKVTFNQDWPRVLDNRFWWNIHRLTQYTAVVLTLISAALIMTVAQQVDSAARIHGLLGWAIVGLSCAQILSAWARGSKGGPTGMGASSGDWRGDHYDMTCRRVAFEYFHKSSGFALLVLSSVTIVLGLILADAPRWMAAVTGGWWFLLAAVAWRLQARGRCLDTYQAIWGPGTEHPGNHRAPIGLGIRQLPPHG